MFLLSQNEFVSQMWLIFFTDILRCCCLVTPQPPWRRSGLLFVCCDLDPDPASCVMVTPTPLVCLDLDPDPPHLPAGDLQDGRLRHEDARGRIDAGEANRQDISPDGQEPRRPAESGRVYRGRQERPVDREATTVRSAVSVAFTAGSYSLWIRRLPAGTLTENSRGGGGPCR